MSYRIAQDEQYLGHDRWKWQVWIEASPEELDQLDAVTWILHPTFSPSRVTSHSREDHFRLKTSGWGTFVLRAQLQQKGRPEALIISHKLKLSYPDESQRQAPPKAPARSVDSAERSDVNSPTIFLSYSSEDQLQAQQVRSSVERMGARVLDASAISAGLPFEASIKKMIRESDAVMSVVGSDYVSPSVVAEMKMAQAEEKPTVTVLFDEASWPSGLPHDIYSVRMKRSPNVAESNLADSDLAEFIGKLTT